MPRLFFGFEASKVVVNTAKVNHWIWELGMGWKPKRCGLIVRSWFPSDPTSPACLMGKRWKQPHVPCRDHDPLARSIGTLRSEQSFGRAMVPRDLRRSLGPWVHGHWLDHSWLMVGVGASETVGPSHSPAPWELLICGFKWVMYHQTSGQVLLPISYTTAGDSMA